MHLVTVVVPCYNEEPTLDESVRRVLDAFDSDPDTDVEILIVDDCSTDRSIEVAERLTEQRDPVRLIRHESNTGKGGALQTGFQAARGDFVTIHDADLKYDPFDLLRLLGPLKSDDADVVYGSRFSIDRPHRVLYFWHSMGNKFLTTLSNMLTDLNLTDMETCYKVFKKEIIESFELHEKRFGIEPEMTACVADLKGKNL